MTYWAIRLMQHGLGKGGWFCGFGAFENGDPWWSMDPMQAAISESRALIDLAVEELRRRHIQCEATEWRGDDSPKMDTVYVTARLAFNIEPERKTTPFIADAFLWCIRENGLETDAVSWTDEMPDGWLEKGGSR